MQNDDHDRKNTIAKKIKQLPIVQFYSYLFQHHRELFFSTLFVNYLLPFILETGPFLPFFFSKRKLSRFLRHSRNSLQHRLIQRQQIPTSNVFSYVGFTMVYSFLHVLDDTLRTRVALANRLVIKKLVMEKVLYSEIGSLQECYERVVGEPVRTEQLEFRVFNDINQTLHLFNFLIPSVIRTGYSFVRTGFDLFSQKKQIDFLAVARPAVVGLIDEIFGYIRNIYVDDVQMLRIQKNSNEMSQVVNNIVDGLTDIQVNNYQKRQLTILDQVIQDEIRTKQGGLAYLSRVYRTINSRSVFDFASELYIVSYVMNKRDMDHETFQKIQNDVDYLMRIGRSFYNNCRQGYEILDSQSAVVALLNLPTFQHETFHPNALAIAKSPSSSSSSISTPKAIASTPPSSASTASEATSSSTLSNRLIYFRELEVRDIHFSYSSTGSPLVLDFNDETVLKIERGRTYALVGQNRCGKSTLVQILCKLLSAPQGVTFNGIPYAQIPRMHLRSIISYVPQRPYIFPGTIASNILLAKPSATMAEVEKAAELAGLFILDSQSTNHYGVKDGDMKIGDQSSSNDAGAAGAGRNNGKKEKGKKSIGEHFSASNGMSFGGAPLKPWQFSRIQFLRELWKNARASAPVAVLSSLYSALLTSSGSQEEESEDMGEFDVSSESAFVSSVICPEVAENIVSHPTASVHQRRISDSERERRRQILEMKTIVRGTNLSGGFAQSVALARVFLRPESQILILDEALSAMDAIKKHEVILPSLFDFVKKNGTTLLFITHDLRNIRSLDKIFVMDKGKLVEQGTHAELLTAPNYARLLGMTAEEMGKS